MPKFVIHKHRAKRAGLHFDLRLERRSKFASWALPKAKLPKKKGERFYAVRMADHSFGYGDFEGEIPSGYGAGTVTIYDRGTYENLGWEKGKIKFKLNGEKEQGAYVLLWLADRKIWLLLPYRKYKMNESSSGVQLYRITPTPEFTLNNKWYKKLRDPEASGVVFFAPTVKMAETWAQAILREQKKKSVYIHDVSVKATGLKRQSFTFNHIKYDEVLIKPRYIEDVTIHNTRKFEG